MRLTIITRFLLTSTCTSRIQNPLLLPPDRRHHRRPVPAGAAAGHRARAGQGEAAGAEGGGASESPRQGSSPNIFVL